MASATLLAVQPLFEPMDSDARWSIRMGAALVGVMAAGVSWSAHRLHKGDAASREAAERAAVSPPETALLAEARVESSIARAQVPTSPHRYENR